MKNRDVALLTAVAGMPTSAVKLTVCLSAQSGCPPYTLTHSSIADIRPVEAVHEVQQREKRQDIEVHLEVDASVLRGQNGRRTMMSGPLTILRSASFISRP